MLNVSKYKRVRMMIRAQIREKCILLGIIPPPQAGSFSENKGRLSDEQKRAHRA